MKHVSMVVGGIVAVVLGACTSAPGAETPQQQAYLEKVMASPLGFTVGLDDLDPAIDRAIDWLSQYHDLELTAADRGGFKEATRTTDAGMLVTPMSYNVGDLGSHAFAVNFAVRGSLVDVVVMAQHEGGLGGLGSAVERRAHILAYYIKTGELMPELIGG